MKRRWIGTVAVLLAAAPVRAETAREFVEARYGDLQGLVARIPQKEALQAEIRKVMDTFVDYEELSRRTLGSHWDALKPKERKEFQEEFRKMVQRSYVKRFDPGKSFTIEYGDMTTGEDGSVAVNSTIRSGRSEARVDYVLQRKKGSWWAFDVVIDEVSMVRNYRKQFHDILQKEGFAGLMDRLRKKNARAQE
ncbi:ABC transporter substrate-binding protein [Myxococcota bacterium]|nr:ABC transporter substrate-binding protein [Myxococcota bacterium]